MFPVSKIALLSIVFALGASSASASNLPQNIKPAPAATPKTSPVQKPANKPAAKPVRAAAALKGKNILVNGSFENAPSFDGEWYEHQAGSGAVAGWYISSGTIDVYHPKHSVPHGRNILDLTGTSPGVIVQTLETEIGGRYRLRATVCATPWAGPPVKAMFFRVGDQSKALQLESGKNSEVYNWGVVDWDFTAKSEQTVLEIGSLTPGRSGPMIDNVSVVQIKPGKKRSSTFTPDAPTQAVAPKAPPAKPAEPAPAPAPAAAAPAGSVTTPTAPVTSTPAAAAPAAPAAPTPVVTASPATPPSAAPAPSTTAAVQTTLQVTAPETTPAPAVAPVTSAIQPNVVPTSSGTQTGVAPPAVATPAEPASPGSSASTNSPQQRKLSEAEERKVKRRAAEEALQEALRKKKADLDSSGYYSNSPSKK